MEAVTMDEMDQQQQTQGPVTLEDVREAIGEMDPRRINAGTIRQQIGRGSLSTIQKHLEAIRRQRTGEAGVDTAQGEIVAPDAPKGLLRGLWESAYGLALATVQDKLIAAHERIADLESVKQGQVEEIEGLAELVDQVEAERDQARAEARAAREAQARAEAERDEALRLWDKIAEMSAKIDAMAKATATATE
jgi:predicted transcriptional regulator